jgi:internalin A
MDHDQEALTRIETEARVRTGMLDLNGLKELRHLPPEIATLTHLQILNFSYTQVSDLSPIAALENLRFLFFSSTQVSDLTPIQTLKNLEDLRCWNTLVGDLTPIRILKNLHNLNCTYTQVSNLTPIHTLTNLQTLDCSNTQVSDLTPISTLTNLQTLRCGRTQVSDLTPIRTLPSLRTLNCNYTPVSDLTPIRTLTNLQTLECNYTPVSDLTPIHALTNLQTLDCYKCPITSRLSDLLKLPQLTSLIIGGVPIADIPAAGVLSEDVDDNCLDRLRAYFADLAKGQAATDAHIKLLILGNGGVGKTQITGRLCDPSFTFNEKWDSTHGIRITSAALPAIDGIPVTLSVWDFGGQDIYHGTHALFLNSPAIQVLVWDKDIEQRRRHGSADQWFRDYPLSYWLALVRLQGPANSPIIPVQSKCDHVTAECDPPHVRPEAVKDLPFPWRPQSLSAKTAYGWSGFMDRLRAAAAWMRDPRNGHAARIGQGWDQVRTELRAMPTTRHLMSMDSFKQLCATTGMGSDPATLLSWLNGDGTVFYREGLFDNQIVLNQQWALDAIYALFDREKGALKALREGRGRFTRDLLARLVWQEYNREEQELFLSMMTSCGICFKSRTVRDLGTEVPEYIAPDLLPDHASITDDIARHWRDGVDGEQATLSFPILHGGLIRRILSDIGGMSGGHHALYWNRGILGLDEATKSHFRIEQDEQQDEQAWSGRITIRTQGGKARDLLSRLLSLTYATIERIGLKGAELTNSIAWSHHAESRDAGSAPLTLAAMKPHRRNWFVSYAWGQNEFFVDCLCDAAKTHKIDILRDRNEIGMGDSIPNFMNRLRDGERVFVVLSDKYLRSPNCMYELAEIWDRSKKDPKNFLPRICLWTMPDAKIWTPAERALYAVHWREEYNKLNDFVQDHGEDILGPTDRKALHNMRGFSTDVGEILATLANHIQPRTWAQILEHGFAD